MIYDLIIVGAGAAGLFAGASLPRRVNGLILEKKAAPGRKLLMTGSGQCNLTHGGSIKDFTARYGENGPRIRSILYQFNNLSVADFFTARGVPLLEREDGKIFPRSLKSHDVLHVLMKSCMENGLKIIGSSPVDSIARIGSGGSKNVSAADFPFYTIRCGDSAYYAKNLLIAAGGCSYPATGSDGDLFPILGKMGFEINPLKPALVPIHTKRYPYRSLAGISFPDAEVTVGRAKIRDALLLTHTCFSGPAILNLSRYARPGDTILINYCPGKSAEQIQKELYQSAAGNNRQLLTVLYEFFNGNSAGSSSELPKRFLEAVCSRAGADPGEKASRIPGSSLKAIAGFIVRDSFIIEKLGGFDTAMVTAGGVSLSEINIKTMESFKYPRLYFAGEVLDVDGDTGGYNLQFAFSSGRLAAHSALR